MSFLDDKFKYKKSERIPELNKNLPPPEPEAYFFKKGDKQKKKKKLTDKDIFVSSGPKKKSNNTINDRKRRAQKRSEKVTRINKAVSSKSKRGLAIYLSKSNPTLDGTLTRRREKLTKFVNKYRRGEKAPR